MADEMIDDIFETVAVTWSQPEAAVIMSMFAFYDIPALTVGAQAVRTLPYYIVAFQGIHVRVHRDWLDEARELLGEVAERPAAVRPYLFGAPWVYRSVVWIAGALYFWALLRLFVQGAELDESQAILLGWMLFPGSLLMLGAPPPRTPSTFLLRIAPA